MSELRGNGRVLRYCLSLEETSEFRENCWSLEEIGTSLEEIGEFIGNGRV